MCLAVPAKIIEREKLNAKVEVGGLIRKASLMLLPDAAVGDYVLIHAGFAITLVDEQEAKETLHIFDQMSKSLMGDTETSLEFGDSPDDGERPFKDV